MSRAVSPSVDRVYGLVRVARCWNVSRATVYRHQQAPAGSKRRPGPVGPGDDATLLQHIRQAIAESLHRRGLPQRSGRDCALPPSAPRPAGCGA